MRINLKKRFTALMLAGMMVTSNVLPAYSATDGIAVEQAVASYEGQAADSEASADAENSEAGGASSEQDDTGKPVADAVDSDSTSDASANAGDESHVAGAAAGSASSTSASGNAGAGSAAAGEQTTVNKSEATSGTAKEETKSDAANGTATEETKSDAANGTVTEETKADVANGATTEESKSDAANGTVTEEGKSDAANGTGAEESKADAVHGSNAGGSSVVGVGSVGIDESTAAAVEIEETKPAELLEEETKLATESEIPKEEDEKKLEEKENRKIIYTDIRTGIKVTATLEDADAVPDDARLHVSEIKDKKMYAAYLEAMDEAEPEIRHTKDNTVLRDISFIMKDEDGKEIEYEPKEGSVKITIEYLENHLQDWFGVEDAAEVKTYHLPLAEGVKAEGEKTIDVQNVKASDINVQELDSDVKTEKKVEVEVDSFSMFAMRRAKARTTGSISLDDAIKKITVIKINDENFDPDKHYPRDAKIEFKMEYIFPENNKPVANGIQTATYTLPEVLDANNTSGDIWCSDYSTKIPAGRYEIKGGIVTFNYTTEFLTAHPTGISGTFSFKSGLSKAVTTNQEKVEIHFAGSGTTTPITIQLEEGKVSANKSYKLNEDGTIDFTIDFEVKGKDVKNLVLTDTQGSNLSFADPAEFKLGGEVIDSSKVTINGQTATINLGNVKIGKYKLTYKSRPKDKTTTSGEENKNTASFTWDGGSEETTKIVKTKDKLLKKEGYAEGNIITWKITYVPGEWGSVAGKEFTDTLGENQKYIGNYTIYYASNGSEHWVPEDEGHKIVTEPLPTDATSFKYTLPSDSSTMGAYRIVYQTEITKDLSKSQTKETFTNKIEGDDKKDNKEVVIDKTPTTPTNLDVVKKSGVANPHDRTATWTVTITPSEGKTLTNLVLRDELQDGFSCYVEDSVQVKLESRPLEKDVDYTLQFIPREENNHGSKMIVKFLNPVTKVIEITYQSDYKNSTSTTWAKNKVQSSYTVDEKDYSEWDEGVVYFPENGKDVTLRKEKTGFSEGVATWKVKINDQDGSKRVQLSDELLKNIVDTLPEGMVYVAGSLKCAIHKSKYNGRLEKYDDVTVDFDEASRKLSVHINNLDISQDRYIYIELEYETRIKSIPETSGNGTTVNGNKVTFNNEVRVGNATASADVTLSNKVLDKKGKQAKKLQNVVEYTLGVNYGAADLLPEKDTLELSDILDANMTLDTGSIQVKDMYTGDAVAYKVSFGTTLKGENTITLTIPDERALLVTYNASLVTAGKDQGKEYKVTNSASLKGTTGGSVKEETKVKYQTSAATVTGTSNSITIKKVDEQGKSLSGATFVIQKVKPSNLENDGETQTITTNDLGTAKFTGLSYNTLYYYQETEAPSGYQKDDTKHYLIIKNAENETEFNQLTSEIKEGTTYGTYPDGLTINVENKKIPVVPTRLVITKTISGDVTDEEVKAAVKFKVTAPDKTSTEYTLNDFVNGGAGKYKLTIDPAQAGKYTVEETGYDIEGQTVKVSYAVNGGTETEGRKTDVTVEAKKTVTVAFKDAYTSKPARLVITKTISGDATEDEVKAAVKFQVKAPDGTSTEYTLDKFTKGTDGKYTLTIDPAKAGKYTVEETGYDIEGQTVKVSYAVNGGAETEGQKTDVEVEAKKTATVAFSNAYTSKPAKLVITKTISGDATEDEVKAAVKFKVTAPDKTSTEYTLNDFVNGGAGKYKLTIDPAQAGKHTVEETGYDIEGQTVKVSYAVNGGAETEGQKTDVKVEAKKTATVAFSNAYTSKPAKLVITKTISGDVTDEEVKAAVKFQVTAPDGKSTEYTLDKFTKGTDGKYTLTIDPAQAGKYTVEETGYDIEGQTVKVSYAVNGGAETEGQKTDVEVEAKKTATVAFSNAYTSKPAKLVITKTISGDATEDEVKAAVKFQVKAPDGTSTEYTLNDFVEGTDGKYTLTIAPAQAGKYTVEETGYDIEGQTVKVSYAVNGGAETEGQKTDVEVEAKKTATVAFKDAYTSKPTVPETTPVETTPVETTVPETTPAETTTPSGGGGGGGGEHPHPLPETTPVETTPEETTVPETTPVETTTPGGGHGGPSEEVETDEYGRVRGANRGKNKNGQDGGNVKGANRGKTRTGDESMMSIFGFGFLAAVLVLLGWFGIRFTKRNRR